VYLLYFALDSSSIRFSIYWCCKKAPGVVRCISLSSRL